MVQKMFTIFTSLQKLFIFSGLGNKISVQNIERAYTTINSSKEIKSDVWHTFCATRA